MKHTTLAPNIFRADASSPQWKSILEERWRCWAKRCNEGIMALPKPKVPSYMIQKDKPCVRFEAIRKDRGFIPKGCGVHGISRWGKRNGKKRND